MYVQWVRSITLFQKNDLCWMCDLIAPSTTKRRTFESPQRIIRSTSLPSWKNLKCHISDTGRPIHFTFGSRVGVSWTADAMALCSVRTNPRWRRPPSWKNFEWTYLLFSACGRPIHYMFCSRVGFSGTTDRMALFLPTTCTANLLWRQHHNHTTVDVIVARFHMRA